VRVSDRTQLEWREEAGEGRGLRISADGGCGRRKGDAGINSREEL